MAWETRCTICRGKGFIEVDNRTWCEVGNPHRDPILKCLACDRIAKNCTCNQ